MPNDEMIKAVARALKPYIKDGWRGQAAEAAIEAMQRWVARASSRSRHRSDAAIKPLPKTQSADTSDNDGGLKHTLDNEPTDHTLLDELAVALREIGVATIVKFDNEKEAVEKMHSALFWESIACRMQQIAWNALIKYNALKNGGAK
jgi:hypothetical protein